ncbi:MAG TPA: MBL fold metallo-hydrolase [Candidatus Thermoplasmatota archaeon]|nr:MBL fold metallo-hydrolase [Candidatus Thermoplasmatota archaeon]
MGRFDDRLTHPLPTGRDMWRILREGGFRPKDAKAAGPAIPRGEGTVPECSPEDLALTWVGHATYLVQVGGLRVLTDPVWRPRLPGFIPRLSAPGIPLEAAQPDVAVVSHDHYDHLDAWTFSRLPKDIVVLCPLGLASWFRRRGFRDVRELDWWGTEDVGGTAFTFVPAHHWGRRMPWDTNDKLWGGWVMEADGWRAYHSGDTAYGTRFQEIARRKGPVDVAMLPIGAYEPQWFMRNVHMGPEEAVQAWDDLQARVLATMHWGTYPLTREPVLEPPARVRKAWEGRRRKEGELWDLAVGESRVLTA